MQFIKKILFIFCIIGSNLLNGQTLKNDTLSILFLGNSFTHMNDMPAIFNKIAIAKGKSVHVSKNTQELPQLNVKEEHFITYKKQNMLNDVDELVSKYKYLKEKMVVRENFENLNDPELQKFANIFITHLIDYSKKYRSISCPNTNFVKQLATLL